MPEIKQGGVAQRLRILFVTSNQQPPVDFGSETRNRPSLYMFLQVEGDECALA